MGMWRYQRFVGWLCRQQCRRTLVALSICGLLITGCAPVTGDAVRDARRVLGLESAPLMHSDVWLINSGSVPRRLRRSM